MEEWVRCPKCGHKLFRILRPCGAESVPSIEIKCSSCKALVNLNSAFTGIPTPTVYELCVISARNWSTKNDG